MNNKVTIVFSSRHWVIILATACWLMSMQAIAQQAEGEVRYLATHNWVKKVAALDYISGREREKMAYLWSNRAEWKEYMRLYFSPTRSKYEESPEKAEADMVGYEWRKEPLLFYRDFERRYQRDVQKIQGKVYLIEDTLQCPTWKVLNDVKEVAGFVCMNAVWRDTLKGHYIEVWFALDLPSPAGPEDLCGLPGLILEANYNHGALVLVADRIDLRSLSNELELPEKKPKGKKISREQYRQMVRKYMLEQKEAEEAWFWGVRY